MTAMKSIQVSGSRTWLAFLLRFLLLAAGIAGNPQDQS